MPDTAGGGGGFPQPHHRMNLSAWEGEVGPSMEVGRSIPAGLYLCQSAPIIVGGQWRLTSPQGRNTPDKGGPEQRRTEESLAPAIWVLS